MSTRPTPICHRTIAPIREPYESSAARASDCIGSNCSLWTASERYPEMGRCADAERAAPWPNPYIQEK